MNEFRPMIASLPSGKESRPDCIPSEIYEIIVLVILSFLLEVLKGIGISELLSRMML